MDSGRPREAVRSPESQPELQGLRLTREEELEMFEEYIPRYFEDDAPLSIMMAGMPMPEGEAPDCP